MAATTHAAWQFALGRGMAFWRQGRTEKAAPWLERALRLGPDQPKTCYALGRFRVCTGRAGGEGLLRRAFALDSGLVGAIATLSRHLADHGRHAQALLDLGCARKRQEHLLFDVIEAEICVRSGRLERAQCLAQTILQRTPIARYRNVAQYILARTENANGLELAKTDAIAAAFAFRCASRLDPKWPEPRDQLRMLYEQQGWSMRTDTRG